MLTVNVQAHKNIWTKITEKNQIRPISLKVVITESVLTEEIESLLEIK